MSRDTFKVLMFHGRPGSGKSETIDYLKKTPLEERIKRFHIGEFIAIDDFPMLWAWFEEDAILEELGQERLHTTRDGFFKDIFMWDLLVKRLCLDYRKLRAEKGDEPTIIIEFSRGKQHGGYERSYRFMEEEILKEAALFFVSVDFEESMRKNLERKNPDKLHSILEHSVETDKLEVLYRHCDFEDFSKADDEYLHIKDIKFPYAVLDNQDDLTTDGGPELGAEMERLFDKLWKNYRKIHND